jgi:starvation-inducible DNA-binding protein
MESILNQLIASSYSFYFLTHSAHWNLIGIEFIPYHKFFGEIYQEVFDQIDILAEYLKINNFTAPISLSDTLKQSKISTILNKNKINLILNQLIIENRKLIDLFNELYQTATKNNKQAIANYAASRLDYHEKLDWQMKASNTVLLNNLDRF